MSSKLKYPHFEITDLDEDPGLVDVPIDKLSPYSFDFRRNHPVIIRASDTTGVKRSATVVSVKGFRAATEFQTRMIHWRHGTLIQDAFPELTVEEREFICNGNHEDDWAPGRCIASMIVELEELLEELDNHFLACRALAGYDRYEAEKDLPPNWSAPF